MLYYQIFFRHVPIYVNQFITFYKNSDRDIVMENSEPSSLMKVDLLETGLPTEIGDQRIIIIITLTYGKP